MKHATPPTKHARIPTWLMLVGLSGCILTACADKESEDIPSHIADQSASELKAARAEADSNPNVSDAQKAILAKDSIVYEDYEKAIDAYLSCVESKGLKANRGNVSDRAGKTEINYTIESGSSEEELSAAEQIQGTCYAAEASYVDMYWQSASPGALMWAEQFNIDMLPFMRDCLAEQGIDFAEDASLDELTQIDLSREVEDGNYCYAQGQAKFE